MAKSTASNDNNGRFIVEIIQPAFANTINDFLKDDNKTAECKPTECSQNNNTT